MLFEFLLGFILINDEENIHLNVNVYYVNRLIVPRLCIYSETLFTNHKKVKRFFEIKTS